MPGYKHELAPVALVPKGQPAHHLLAAARNIHLDGPVLGIGLRRIINGHVDVLALPACNQSAVLSHQLAVQCSDNHVLLETGVPTE